MGLFSGKHLHFIGIGGAGMSSLAEIACAQGAKVSGSDVMRSPVTTRLEQLGCQIFIGHQASHIGHAEIIIVSSAISDHNPELLAAHARGLKIWHRSDLLGALMQSYESIAVCGAHGKTTTTALLGYLFRQAGESVTMINGGTLLETGANAHVGSGRFCVAEADESDASFLKLHPQHTLITNIDFDHMDTYGHSADKFLDSFDQFASQTPATGHLVMCSDDRFSQQVLARVRLKRSVITVGFAEGADWQIQDFKSLRSDQRSDQVGIAFTLTGPHHTAVPIRSNMAGRYSAYNIALAIAMMDACGLSLQHLDLSGFQGVYRRANSYDLIWPSVGKLLMIDDYAHHPKELESVMAGFRERYPERRQVVVFQPHRYTRTRDLAQEFVQVLKTADLCIVMGIYAASEAPILGIDGQTLVKGFQKLKLPVLYAQDWQALEPLLSQVLQPHDVLMMLGAGDIGKMSEKLYQSFKKGAHR